jgi:hypothetical protein
LLILVKKAIFQNNGDDSEFGKILTYDELRSKANFFGNGPVIVCCEMSYQNFVDGSEPPKIDNDVRENLWSSYQEGLYDGVTINVEDKQFKVS